MYPLNGQLLTLPSPRHDPDGNAFVRDDIVQYLRGTSNFDDATGEDAMGSSLASTARLYGQSRSFLTQFTEVSSRMLKTKLKIPHLHLI